MKSLIIGIMLTVEAITAAISGNKELELTPAQQKFEAEIRIDLEDESFEVPMGHLFYAEPKFNWLDKDTCLLEFIYKMDDHSMVVSGYIDIDSDGEIIEDSDAIAIIDNNEFYIDEVLLEDRLNELVPWFEW